MPRGINRIPSIHGREHVNPEEARTVGRVLYASMLDNADGLNGDMPAVTGVHVQCGLETLLRAVTDMDRQNHIRWRLESIMDANILAKPELCWTLRVITWGKDRQTAETLGDTLLMATILNQPDIDPDQPFDRWHVPITEQDGEIHSGTLNLLNNKVSIKETNGDYLKVAD